MKFSSIAFALLATATGCVGIPIDPDFYKKDDRRRRRMAVSEVSSHECADQLYSLALVVEGAHVALSAEPKCDGGSLRSGNNNSACQEKCPSLLFHASLDPGENRLTKSINEFQQEHLQEGTERLDLGSFDLNTLVEAFDNTPLDESKTYNMFSHNCASVPATMIHSLGMDPHDSKVVKFVALNLSKNAPADVLDILPDDHTARIVVIEDFAHSYMDNRLGLGN